MASKTRSIHRGVARRMDRQGAKTQSDYETVDHQVLALSGFCAVCFLVFGSQETRVVEGDKVVHPRCLERLRKRNAA